MEGEGEVGIDRRGRGKVGIVTWEWVGGGVWIGVSGRGGGERVQTVGWEGERVGIYRWRSGVGGGESGDRQEE